MTDHSVSRRNPSAHVSHVSSPQRSSWISNQDSCVIAGHCSHRLGLVQHQVSEISHFQKTWECEAYRNVVVELFVKRKTEGYRQGIL